MPPNTTETNLAKGNRTLSPSQDFSINIPDTLKSSDLFGNATFEDVFKKSREAQNQQSAQTQLNQLQKEQESKRSIFDNPESFIISTLYGDNEPTALEKQAQNIRGDITQTIGGIDESLTQTRERGERQTGISELSKGLAETNEKIAQRRAQFRRELRAFETDAERRGVARGFFEDERRKLESDATAELADLYIISEAQRGNVDSAQKYIDTAVENRYRSIEIELSKKQSQLDELMPSLQKEQKEEALKLQIALDQRKQNLDNEIEDEKVKRQILANAVKNGAGSEVQRAILNAPTVNDAYLQAGGWLDKLDRIAAQQSIQNASLDRRAKLIDLALKGDKQAIDQLGEYGKFITKNDAKNTYDFENATKKIFLIDQMFSNQTGFDLSTGTFQNPLVKGVGTGLVGGAVAGGALGSIVPGVGTLFGTVAGGIGGTIGGTINYAKYNNARNDFLADMKSIIAPEALDELVRRKEQGATFGALSNAELALLVQASQELAGHIVFDTDGNVSEIIGSPEAVQSDLIKVRDFYLKSARQANIQLLDEEDSLEIGNIYNQ